MENIEFTEAPKATSDALAESDAEDAALDAAAAHYFTPDGNLKDAPGAAANEPAPVSLATMTATGGRLMLDGKPCPLSALTLTETTAVEEVLSSQPPLVYAAVLTDPPTGGAISDIDLAAVASVAGALMENPNFGETQARAGFNKVALLMTRQQKSDLAGIILTSVRKASPGVDEQTVLSNLTLGQMIGTIRQIFTLSGGLGEVFTGA